MGWRHPGRGDQRSIIRAGLVCLLAAPFCACAAEGAGNFPVRPVRWIVPYPAAGSIDLVARIIASKLAGVWGQILACPALPGNADGRTLEVILTARFS
jgi:tripartite-type tricarboxylate transporter receptor subunit TctC